MLWFLGLAAQEGYVVDRYVDPAQGVMGKNGDGREAITRVTLEPAIVFSGSKVPSDASVARLHHSAHENCFLASSVETVIDTKGSWTFRP
jgi:organic hydroperoxide reductase OsmC/OhrA